jgi:S-formylglutathione hydrolase FrmB
MMYFKMVLACLAMLGLGQPAIARVEKTVVHSAAVEGNLEGNSAHRTVFVILPDSYDKARNRRYPVVYFLHGFNSTAQDYAEGRDFDASLQASGAQVIIVVPDTMTKWGGSMYANSPTVGNFEDFIAGELVAWTDKHFRTIARREARGLAGHSMGGHGTFKLGMKHADVFSALYAMNPCCQIPRLASSVDPKLESYSVDQALAADWLSRGYFAISAAWAPNPGKPPFYADLAMNEGKVNELVIAKWAANAPIAMASQYLPVLRRMRGIGLDTGDTDFVRADYEQMHDTLTRFGIKHDGEIYMGDHGNRVQERFRTHVLPFFTKHLKGSAR